MSVKKGQSALDYLALLIVTATVILLLGSRLQPKLEAGFSKMGDKIVYEIGQIK